MSSDDASEEPMTDEPLELTDEMVAAKWEEFAHAIEVITARIADPNDFVLQPSSQLAEDDALTSPYQMSHCVRWCLNSGVDHLHALKSLVVDGRRFHSSAPYSLARGALENLGAGFWLLHPSQQTTRVERAARCDGGRRTSKIRTRQRVDIRLGNYTPFQTKLAILVGMADAVSCDSTRLGNGYTSSEAPRYADENSSALRPFLIWQLCSGFAHGRPWASLGMNAMASRPSDDEGVKLVRLTSDPRRILSVTFPAMRLLEDLLRVYQERSQAS